MASKMDGQDVATTKINDKTADIDMDQMEKKQENDNLNNEEKETCTALDFVNNAIDGIIKKLKLHKLSSMGNQIVKTNKKNKNDKTNANDEIEDWQSNEDTYETVICDNTVLLTKLLQLADDIYIGNDNVFTKERKISILQNIGFAISRMDSKINECDGFMEMNEVFLQPIDNSGEMKSKLKNSGEMMDEKSVKDLIRTMHGKTKMQGLMTDETQISMIACYMSMSGMRHSMQQIFKCIKVYIIVCQSLELDEQMESRKVKDFVLSEEFESECDEIFEVAKEYLDLPKIDKESDDSDSHNDNNTGNDNSNNSKADNNKCKKKVKKKKVVKTCDGVRFDKENSIINKRVYYSSKVLENVYNGVLDWDKTFEYGCDYYSIDCGNNLLSFCAGTGWKYREPAIGCYYFDNNNDYFDTYSCNPGFGDVPRHCYCDDIYNRCWYQGDSRIKGTYVIDDNGNNKKKNEKKNDNDDDDDDDNCNDENDDSSDNHGFEYILRGNGSITGRKDAIMSLNYQGTLQVWYYDKLMKQNRSYWSLLGDCDDDDLPAKDEFGIKLNRHLTQNIGFDDDGDATIEISTGQSPHLTKRIELFNKNEKIGHIVGNHDGIQMSRIGGVDNNDKLVLSYSNTLNMYDLNKECVDNVYLASRFSVKLPKRQHLYGKDNCTLISYDFNCVKIWDTRMSVIAHTSIYGCGKKRIETALGFSINGHSFIATGGNDEAVTIWDLRKQNNNNNGALYEMSTGNNVANELAWHESSLKLYATTECMYVDRLGGRYYGSGIGDIEEYDSDGNELDWPDRAIHKKGDFKSNYDAGANVIYSYSFSSN